VPVAASPEICVSPADPSAPNATGMLPLALKLTDQPVADGLLIAVRLLTRLPVSQFRRCCLINVERCDGSAVSQESPPGGAGGLASPIKETLALPAGWSCLVAIREE
jgi:hypothetical protein